MSSEGVNGAGARPRKRNRAATESALMGQAIRLLERNGVLAGLNLQEVADEAGVNRSLIHQYFGSRQALLRAAIEHAKGPYAEELARQFEIDPRARGARSFEAAAEDPRMIRLVALLALDGDDEFDPIPLLERQLDQLRQEQAAGVWREDADIEALLVIWTMTVYGYSLFRESLARQMAKSVVELDAQTLRGLAHLFREGFAERRN